MAEEKANWGYKADEPKNSSSKNSNRAINWTASEFIDHKRGVTWYLLLIIGTIVLAAMVYLILKDRFATGTIVLLGIIISSVAHWKPKQIEYRLSPNGLQAGSKTYDYRQFKTFSILHEGQLSSLMFHPLKRFMLPISVFFDEADEDEIISLVGERLPLEERAPDRIDRLSRRLRF